MALKVGDRVRVIGLHVESEDNPKVRPLVGAEGVIVAIDNMPCPCDVLFSAGPLNARGRCIWSFERSELAPAVDPDEWADAQIAKLKKLGPLPVKEVA